MNTRKLYFGNNGRVFLTIPAYLRDKYGLEKGMHVDVTDNGTSIVITPVRER
jgi:bifunctional DNA-binding transcriptional regulator/antitoxin component of YhaV-PrlF toxin-antitoxin module